MLRLRGTSKLFQRPGRWMVLFIGAALNLAAFAARAAETDTAGVEFFERKIRPVLVENCYQCHSAKAEKIKGGLSLDTREATLKGGDSGPAIVPGSVEKSLLIKAVRYVDADLQMPPKNKKLSAGQIADFEAWVKMGAPDPRDASSVAKHEADRDKSRTHWAFQPVVEPKPPNVKNKRWVQSPVDAFVLAKLEANKMKPSPPADRRTLIRRATFDLTGLPPTPGEVAAFVADKSPQAFAHLVDRLLASPRYGERWGRYWLDVARYADTKGYVGNEGLRYPYAYTYRDYVIRAFNEDLPYDQFIIQQLAADRLKLGEDNRPLAALGFLTVGRRFINNENDIIDDRIDVICRGTMGLTAGCARCHDHKFDPIPTQDYYSLYGVLKSSTEPADKPLLSNQPTNAAYPAYVVQLAKLENGLKQYTASNEVAVLTKLRSQVGDYLIAVHDCRDLNDVKRDELVRGQRKMNMAVFKRWDTALAGWGKTNNPIFSPWFALSALPEKEFAEKAPPLLTQFAANDVATNRLNPVIAGIFKRASCTNLQMVAGLYNDVFAVVSETWECLSPDGATNGVPGQALENPDEEALRQVLYAENAPANPPRDQFGNIFLFDDSVKAKIETMKKDIVALDASHPGAPARAMVLEDKPKPVTSKVFIRGNPGTQGAVAPRRFLEVASGPNRELFPTNSSGRLELAKAIVSRDNPLTARVFVNRVWLNHFGAPLVRTPGDFGVRSEPPANPELLDFLAAHFMDEGWSMKELHRTIMLSSAYQQSSDDNPACSRLDPENRLLWRMNRRRLDFEATRDSLLSISANLDLTPGGQPVDITTNAPAGRRTVYSFVDRQDLPNLFRIFDFANPDTSSPQRFQTIVAPQALYMLNSQFVIDRVRNVVERATNAVATDPKFVRLTGDERYIRSVYQYVLQREPTPREVKAAREFFLGHPAEDSVVPEVVAWNYGYGSYDETAHRVTDFKPFVKFTGKIWQSGDKIAGNAQIDAEGGQPAPTNAVAAIRRWIAPRDGHVKVTGEFSHSSTDGDGVHGRIVSSRFGDLGEWVAFNNKVDTDVDLVEVHKGDTLDFLADCRANATADAFKWSPVIQMMDGEPQVMTGQPTVWEAKQNFADPQKLPKPLNAWEEFAQVLLLSNEFVFVD